MEIKDKIKIEFNVVLTKEEDVYSITSIEMPWVVSQGNSIEEAKKRLQEAIELYLEGEKTSFNESL